MGDKEIKIIDIKDKMALLFNNIIQSIAVSELKVSQVNLVIDLVKDDIINSSKKLYMNRGKEKT